MLPFISFKFYDAMQNTMKLKGFPEIFQFCKEVSLLPYKNRTMFTSSL